MFSCFFSSMISSVCCCRASISMFTVWSMLTGM